LEVEEGGNKILETELVLDSVFGEIVLVLV
jgi:hypothetical protein